MRATLYLFLSLSLTHTHYLFSMHRVKKCKLNKRKIRVTINNRQVANEIIYDLITFKLLSFMVFLRVYCVCVQTMCGYSKIHFYLYDFNRCIFVLRPRLPPSLSLPIMYVVINLTKKKTCIVHCLPFRLYVLYIYIASRRANNSKPK